jgi:hypothetical protein
MELHVEIHNMTEKKIKQLTCTLIKKSTSYVLSQGLRNVNSKKDVTSHPLPQSRDQHSLPVPPPGGGHQPGGVAAGVLASLCWDFYVRSAIVC